MQRKRKPSSPNRIAANQRNSKHSRGPTSVIGKWHSSQNALRHGFCARSPLLLGESAEERAEHDRVILSNLNSFTACQEYMAGYIADVAWIIKRGDRFGTAYFNREALLDVMDRKFPPKDIAYMDGDRPVRTVRERNEILAAHKKDLTPTEQDIETTLHRLYGDRHDLITKFEKASLQNRKLLCQLLARFDQMQKEDRKEQEEDMKEKKDANGGYQDERLGVEVPEDEWLAQKAAEGDSAGSVPPNDNGDNTE
jgi:hypothetical protein